MEFSSSMAFGWHPKCLKPPTSNQDCHQFPYEMADSSGVGSPPKPPGERLAPREEIREVYRLYIMIKYDKSYHRQSLSTKIICSEHNSRKSPHFVGITRLKNHFAGHMAHFFGQKPWRINPPLPGCRWPLFFTAGAGQGQLGPPRVTWVLAGSKTWSFCEV